MKSEVLIQNLNICIYTDSKEDPQNDSLIRDFLDEVIVALDMTVLIPPIGVRIPILNYKDHRNNKIRQDDCGLTHIVGIAESHIATHTWPNYNLIYIEISSCKEFDNTKVEELIKKYFPLSTFTKFENKRIIWSNK